MSFFMAGMVFGSPLGTSPRNLLVAQLLNHGLTQERPSHRRGRGGLQGLARYTVALDSDGGTQSRPLATFHPIQPG